MELVVIDHHQLQVDLTKLDNTKIILASNLEEFYQKARIYIKEDYDLVISDEDPDGITSVIIYNLYKNKKINFLGNRNGLKKEDINLLKEKGIKSIIAFDWFPFNYSDLNDFDKIIYISPRSSNLGNINTSDTVYQALPETGKFGRDISTIGTVCDYLVDNCKEKINSVVLDYKGLFPELINLAEENKLDRYNVYKINNANTKFFDLSLMLWAPFILEGQEGNNKLIELITQNQIFTLNELFNNSNNPTVIYLQRLWKKLENLLKQEEENFNLNKRVIGKLIFYEVKTNKPGFMSKFSSIISDKYPNGEVIVMRTRNENKGIFSHSLRTKIGNYNLGKLMIKLGVGGGHEEAAGANVKIEKEEWFEKELIKEINNF